MESTLYNISQVLGITIIHSLWQGLLIYIILRIAFAGISNLSAVKKYNLAIIALVSILACFIYTLISEINDYNWVNLKPVHALRLAPNLNLPAGVLLQPDFYTAIAHYLPYISVIYFTGLIINTAKLAIEWNKIRQIKLSVLPAGQMQQYIETFSKKLNINKYIQLKFSELIDVPCVIGYFKPLILLPVTIGTSLTADEVEAILLHELSHIKRNDYLMNLLQQFVTVLLFFNPFTRLINRIISQERENRCDDLVVEKTGEPLIYAQALIKLEDARKLNLQLALAATGKKFHLLNRIERIMKTKKHMGSIRHLIIALFLLTGTLSCIAWFNPKNISEKNKIKNFALKSGDYSDAYLADSITYQLLSDTIKHQHKSATAKNKKHSGLKNNALKHKDTFADGAYGDNFAGDSVNSFFNSAEWKKQMEMIRKQGDEMRKRFNSPEWKNQMQAMRKQNEEWRKKFDSKEWKAQAEQMKKMGEQMKKQFDSPEWKSQMLAMQKQGEEWRKTFDNKEWKDQMKKQSDIWKKQAEDMKKQFDSPEWKSQVEQMKRQGEQMKKQFDSPEWKSQMEQMKKMGAQMKKQFDGPEWKSQMEQMKKMGAQMKKQFDGPEWKSQMEQMKKMGEQMKKQFDSPEWKSRKWILKDSVDGSKIYVPQKDTVEKNDHPVKKEDQL